MTGTHPSLSMYASRCSRCPHRMTWTKISSQPSHMSNMWLTRYRTEKNVVSTMSGIPTRHERTYTKLVDRIGVLCAQGVSVEVDADKVESGEERKRDGHKNEKDQCGGEEKDAWNAECARHGWLELGFVAVVGGELVVDGDEEVVHVKRRRRRGKRGAKEGLTVGRLLFSFCGGGTCLVCTSR